MLRFLRRLYRHDQVETDHAPSDRELLDLDLAREANMEAQRVLRDVQDRGPVISATAETSRTIVQTNHLSSMLFEAFRPAREDR